MRYTISMAWVIECEPEALEVAADDPLHTSIVQHMRADATLIRAEFPGRQFNAILSEMIVQASPEVEIAPMSRVEEGADRGGD